MLVSLDFFFFNAMLNESRISICAKKLAEKGMDVDVSIFSLAHLLL